MRYRPFPVPEWSFLPCLSAALKQWGWLCTVCARWVTAGAPQLLLVFAFSIAYLSLTCQILYTGCSLRWHLNIVQFFPVGRCDTKPVGEVAFSAPADTGVSPSLYWSVEQQMCHVRDSQKITRQAFNTAEAISVFNMLRIQANHGRLV